MLPGDQHAAGTHNQSKREEQANQEKPEPTYGPSRFLFRDTVARQQRADNQKLDSEIGPQRGPCYGRLISKDKSEELTMSPQSDKAFKRLLGITTPEKNQIPDLPTTVHDPNATTPKRRQRSASIVLQAHDENTNSPITVTIHCKRLPATPYVPRNRKKIYNTGPTLILSPLKKSRKKVSARVSLNNILEAAADPPRNKDKPFNGHKAIELVDDTICCPERSHLIANRFNGRFNDQNTALTGWHCNAQQFKNELIMLDLLVSGATEYLDVRASATLKPLPDNSGFSHQATTVESSCTTDSGLNIDFSPIDAATKERPSVKERILFTQVISTSCEIRKRKKSTDEQPQFGAPAPKRPKIQSTSSSFFKPARQKNTSANKTDLPPSISLRI